MGATPGRQGCLVIQALRFTWNIPVVSGDTGGGPPPLRLVFHVKQLRPDGAFPRDPIIARIERGSGGDLLNNDEVVGRGYKTGEAETELR